MKPPKATGTAKPLPVTRVNKRVFSIFLSEETLKEIKHLAVDRGVPMQKLGEEAVALLLKKSKGK
jgi:predicted DNA binding CopG/RHH family protein